jgi:formate dehydrogenase major subunit
MTFHYADPLVNTLTGDALDPEAKIPEYKHSAVRVEPVE